MSSPRVTLVEPVDAPLLARPYYATAGETSPIVRALAQVPELIPATMPFVAQALGPGALDLRAKELIVLRVSERAGCTYCVGAHRVAAADAGIDAREDAALTGRIPLEDAFDGDELAILRLCDAVAGGGEVDDAVVAPVRRSLGEHGLVEVVMTAAATLMLNRLCTTLRLPLTSGTAARLRALDEDGARVSAELRQLIDQGTVGPRLWFYTNYHCNLSCDYCLTGSSPRAKRRILEPDRIVRLADQAVEAGFGGFGVSGGEPFLNPWLPELALELARRRPLVLLTNGTLFTERLLRRIRGFAEAPIEIQISLDSADPIENDAMRGPENFARVVAAIPRLVRLGVTVRVASTLIDGIDEELPRLCELHRSLGVDDDHHIVRPIVARGRAREQGYGIAAGLAELFPELTITADGAFWSPFGATARPGAALDTELLLTRQIEPLERPLGVMVGHLRGQPPGTDANLGIR